MSPSSEKTGSHQPETMGSASQPRIHAGRIVFPFCAIVGQEQLKESLLLNAINPATGGVLIRGEKGTAKSTAVRALADLLPEIEVVLGCPFSCKPDRPEETCDFCSSSSRQLNMM